MRKYLGYTSILLVFVGNLSCGKFIEADPPVDKLTSDIIFNDEHTAASAVVGMYNKMMVSLQLNILSGGISVYTGLSADELYNSGTSNTALSEFTNNALLPNNSVSSYDFWFMAYNILYHANACITGLENNNAIVPSVRNPLLAEALFVRSFFYYYLVNLYGDVPLILVTDYEENSKTPRTPSAEIYKQIIADLKTAQGYLSDSYPTEGRARPNKWTVTALLARIYLSLGQWDLAEKEASSIINSNSYSMETDLNNVFLATSQEAIWQLMPVFTGYNTIEGYFLVPASWSSQLPSFILTQHLFNSFEPGDLRKQNWLSFKTVNGNDYYYPFKYKISDYGLPLTEYYMVFRLAEQYLIRAECYAHQERITEARDDLNVIRNRAGLPDAVGATVDEILEAVAHERRIELFVEWGHRWLDLKRTKKATEVLAPIKPGWQATDTLYPIPSGEIQANHFLTQNPGYN